MPTRETNQRFVLPIEIGGWCTSQIAALDRELDPHLGFRGLGLGIGELGHKRCLVPTLSPRLGDVGGDGAGRSADLIH
jgi:hypothetical protein